MRLVRVYKEDGTVVELQQEEDRESPAPDQIIAGYIAALDGYFDRVARAQGFDDRRTCALRAGYPGPFQTIATAFAVWMDNCYVQAQTIKADVLEGRRTPPPTLEQVLAELPAPPWPI